MESIALLRRMMSLAAPWTLVITAGCSEPADLRDQRLAEFARESISEQRKQNSRMADQSEAVVQQSEQLAEAAKQLVQSDAEARREMIASQRERNAEIHQQRCVVDAGREQLEQERRQIAEQRHRDPLLAAAIENTGLLIGCCLPLLVCLFIIRKMQSDEPDHAAVAELLVSELTSDHPRLLPSPPRRPLALEQHSVSEARAVDSPKTFNRSQESPLP